MYEFNFSGTWNMREALDELSGEDRLQAGRLIENRFFLVRNRDLMKLSTDDLNGCKDEEFQFEALIFRPIANRVSSGEWEIWGHPESISHPIQPIPAHFLDTLDAWDFRIPLFKSGTRLAKRPPSFREYASAAFRYCSPQRSEEKVAFLLKTYKLLPSRTGYTLAETARRVQILFKRMRWAAQSSVALEKMVGRVCRTLSDTAD